MNRDLKFRAICEYEHNSERFTDMIYFGMQTFENGLCVFPEHTDKIDYINEYNGQVLDEVPPFRKLKLSTKVYGGILPSTCYTMF